MGYIKVMGAMMVLGVFITAYSIVKSNQAVSASIVALAALLIVGSVGYAVLFLVRHAHGHVTAIKHNRLDLLLKEAELEARTATARASSLMHFNHKDVLIQHSASGVAIQYVPQFAMTQPAMTVTEVEADEPLLLERPMPSGLDLIRSGAIAVDGAVTLGLDAARNLIQRPWKRAKSILVLGLSGQGKSNTLAWLTIQTLLSGGRIAVIDKHARALDESLYGKLKPFESHFDTPIGDGPDAAMRVIRHVKRVIDARLNGAVAEYTLMLVVDELTGIMSKATDKDDAWHDVAIALANLIETINTEGRKVRVRIIAAGQTTNASRTGGSEARDLFNTRIIHSMRARQASMVGLSEYKSDIKSLNAGEVLVDMEGDKEPYTVQVPYLSDDDLNALTRLLVQRAFIPSSDEVHSVAVDEVGTTVNEPTEPVHEYSDRVLQLHKEGISKAAIIQEVWQVRKGGSEKYRQANEAYEAIVNPLA